MQSNTLITCAVCGTEFDKNNSYLCPECHYPIYHLSPSYGSIYDAIESYREKMGIAAPQASLSEGDTYQFGTYHNQDITWRVLTASRRKALLLSEYALDVQPYHRQWTKTSWEKSTLRRWLNTSFYQEAFHPDERARILKTQRQAGHNFDCMISGGKNTDDFVFLLNISEANDYWEYGKCKPTAYARSKRPFTDPGSPFCWWWLGSPGSNESNAAYMTGNGTVYTKGSSVSSDFIAVRPAIWIQL